MADMCDGEAFKTHPLYTVDPQALQVILYYDDLEICNPLGASVKTHKLGKVFFYIFSPSMPLHMCRSILLHAWKFATKESISSAYYPVGGSCQDICHSAIRN